jgi:hypothetical protein
MELPLGKLLCLLHALITWCLMQCNCNFIIKMIVLCISIACLLKVQMLYVHCWGNPWIATLCRHGSSDSSVSTETVYGIYEYGC